MRSAASLCARGNFLVVQQEVSGTSFISRSFIMKLSSVFTRIALSVGLLVSVNAFAQNAHLGVQTIPHKAVVAHQSVANNPTHAMDMDQGCNKIKPSCDMPQKAQEHKAKQSKSAQKTCK
jgi:hypothetical protein